MEDEDPRVNWIMELDCLSNSVDYLRKSEGFLLNDSDPLRWKWATICLTSALYGFMIHVLGSSNWCNVVTFPKTVTRRLVELEESGQANKADTLRLSSMKDANLIAFGRALNWMQDPTSVHLVLDKPLALTQSQRENIRSLRSDLRNQFEHYVPCHWLFHAGEFAPKLLDTVVAIKNLYDTRMQLWQQDDDNEIRSTIQRITQILSDLCDEIESKSKTPESPSHPE